MPTSNRKVYDEELLQLDSMLARMGHAAGRGDLQRHGRRCGRATSNGRAALWRATARSTRSNMTLSTAALTLILRQQPVATDLRKVTTAMKMVTDIERIADQASDIAEIVLHLDYGVVQTFDFMDDIYRMGRACARHGQAGHCGLCAGGPGQRGRGHRPRRPGRQGVQPHQRRDRASTSPPTRRRPRPRSTCSWSQNTSSAWATTPSNVAEWVEFLKTGVHKSARSSERARPKKPFSYFSYTNRERGPAPCGTPFWFLPCLGEKAVW